MSQQDRVLVAQTHFWSQCLTNWTFLWFHCGLSPGPSLCSRPNAHNTIKEHYNVLSFMQCLLCCMENIVTISDSCLTLGLCTTACLKFDKIFTAGRIQNKQWYKCVFSINGTQNKTKIVLFLSDKYVNAWKIVSAMALIGQCTTPS